MTKFAVADYKLLLSRGNLSVTNGKSGVLIG